MQPDERRLLRALAREGLTVTHSGSVYTVRLTTDPSAPAAEILLPSELPLEAKAVKQLAQLASAHHPDGGGVCRVCATPDFHPGDAGVAIGSVVESENILIPAGTDINCGMRLHVTDLSLDSFLAKKAAFVEKLKGDYLLGTRDVGMSASAMAAMFTHGIPAWAHEAKREPLGRMSLVDWDQVFREAMSDDLVDGLGRPFPRVYGQGSLHGSCGWAPPDLVPEDGSPVRDDGLATVGRGNHFVEVQVVDEVVDKSRAYQWGVRKGQVAFMVHSGSRNVGRYIGGLWATKAREAWPKGVKYPESGIFTISSRSDLFDQYLAAEATASNYGFVNRALLAELLRLRLREVYGPSVEAPLVYDLPHNITLPENGKWVFRKGACPAHEGQPVIIPGSMGTSSFLCVGLGNDRWISSASHGAGRAQSRGAMGRFVRDEAHAKALGLEGVECITLREERRIEEAPNAYKDIRPIIDAQVKQGTIQTVARMRPLLTFKA